MIEGISRNIPCRKVGEDKGPGNMEGLEGRA